MNTEANNLLPAGWSRITRAGVDAIEKHWRLPDFAQAMVLANAIAAMADRVDHHPDLQVGYGSLRVIWSSHDVGGVTSRDLSAARATDELAASVLGARVTP